jgi:hypothetical protein
MKDPISFAAFWPMVHRFLVTARSSRSWLEQNRARTVLVAATALAGSWCAKAQPTIVSVSPTNGAAGVSPTTQVVFTFSTSMNTSSSALFSNLTANTFVPTTPVWSANNTVLTYTAIPSFGNNSVITWSVFGFDSQFNPLTGTTSGSFTTGSGGGTGGGSGTNKITSFIVGKLYSFDQTSTAAPTADPTTPYIFGADTILASNRTATNITLTLPASGAVSNLAQNPVEPELYYLAAFNTNQTTFENTFQEGDYIFNVRAVASNQTVTVTLPLTMQQPNAPHVTDYAAAQAINPAQPFTLTWDPFVGGTSTDVVYVVVSGTATNVFETGNLGSTNALNGTAVSVIIPAGTLQANSNYNGSIGFYHAVFGTNDPTYSTTAYRATTTRFTLATGSSVSSPLVITNAFWSPGTVNFDILCSTGQTFTVLWATNLQGAPWQTLYTTSSPGSRVHVSDPRGSSFRSLMYRARNGP